MNLYQINTEISELMVSILPDAETGEYPEGYQEALDRIAELNLKRDDILLWIMKGYLNDDADINMLKEEKKRLDERIKEKEHKNERRLKTLERECGGKKTDFGIAVVSYRKSSPVSIDDEEKAIEWLTLNGKVDCLKYSEPTIDKNRLKVLINSGELPKGLAHIENKVSCSIK